MELPYLLCSGHCWPLARILGALYLSIIAWIEEKAGIVKHFSAPMNSVMPDKSARFNALAHAAQFKRWV